VPLAATSIREIQTQDKTQQDHKLVSPSKSQKPMDNDKQNIWANFEMQ
jgi:hypothetical protein